MIDPELLAFCEMCAQMCRPFASDNFEGTAIHGQTKAARRACLFLMLEDTYAVVDESDDTRVMHLVDDLVMALDCLKGITDGAGKKLWQSLAQRLDRISWRLHSDREEPF